MVINKNANVTVIPARYHAVSQEKDEGKPKLRDGKNHFCKSYFFAD